MPDCIHATLSRIIKLLRANLLLVAVILCSLVLITYLYMGGFKEQIPTITMSSLTAIFSCLAFRYSQEKFRLDLLERRFEIYKEILKYCGIVSQLGGLKATEDKKQIIAEAYKAAESSFMGFGLHSTKALYGPEVTDFVNQLFKCHAWLISYPDAPGNDLEKWANEYIDKVDFIYRASNQLPEIFKPYIYFGDYKKNF